jgi:hypothetical protein
MCTAPSLIDAQRQSMAIDGLYRSKRIQSVAGDFLDFLDRNHSSTTADG